ncbi:hypothetical protein J5N97_021893 [Dioscorea zingiberensis]|uniref:Uncharacterized protein n=1 Tax=Dioscorea zingiberensis TaxID=325984 RepID=A0A9D5HA21_9LILI|nr:hypothetical protein J5N97_021893 [Dioscorea zingiberensis]
MNVDKYHMRKSTEPNSKLRHLAEWECSTETCLEIISRLIVELQISTLLACGLGTKTINVVIDVEGITQSPKITKTLPQKGFHQIERHISEELLVKVATPNNSDEGMNERFHRLSVIHPRRILVLFATMSSMGTMILIYFTLAIKQRDDQV